MCDCINQGKNNGYAALMLMRMAYCDYPEVKILKNISWPTHGNDSPFGRMCDKYEDLKLIL